MATLLLEVAVRAALIATGTACILWALRIRTAAVQHAAWTTVVIAMLLLPIWSVAGPKVPLAVLPTNAASLDSGSGANPDPGNVAPRASVTQPGPTPIAETAPTVSESARGTLVLIGAYLLGAFALLIRLAIGTVHAHRLRRGVLMHAGRATSARCATPITVGWLSPVLILPEEWERWSAAHLDAVVTHEHEHARRHDPLVQWLALLNRAIFWFHPLAWWLERRLANLAEEACDAAVIRAGHSPQDYSDYLIDMARALNRQGRRLDVVGLAMPGSGLPNRMRHIFEELPMKPLPRARVICTLAFCTTSAIVCAAGILAPRPSAVADPHATAGAQVRFDVASPTPSPTLPPPQPPADGRGVPPGTSQLSPGSGRGESATPSEPVGQAHTGTNAQSPNIVEPPRADSPNGVRGDPVQVSTTDLSGHWLLVSSTAVGPGRGGIDPGRGGEWKTMTIWHSWAPVNCGPECTIIQDTKTLTISRLGTPDAVTPYDNGVVVLNLDGSDSTVTESNGNHYIVHAKWNGDRLVVTHEFECFTSPCTDTQTLSIQDGKLKVVDSFNHVVDYPTHETLTYGKG
jgi:beta-lactamase regulating signal transducer with metallopeptidase domain